MISILVDEVTVTVSETEILTAGRVGLECSVSFNGGIWGDLVKKITFEGTESKTLVLADSVVTIPYECLAESGYKLRVGVCGENADGTVVVPTLWADIGKIKPAAPREGAEPETPTPSVVAQIQALATSANSNASAALTMIDDMTVAATASSQVYANISDEGTHKHIEFGIPAMQTVDFDNVTNRPKYNGTAMTSATNVPEVKTALWDSKAAGNHNHDSRYYTETETDTKLALKANTADLATVATSGDYDDLSNKPTIPVVPTNLSDFTDDLGSTPVHTHSQYLTEHQSLSAYRTSAAQDVIDSSLSSVIANKVSYTDKLSQITGAMTTAEKKTACSTIGAVYDGQYELIEEITLTEDVASIYRRNDPQGNNYNLKKLLIWVNIAIDGTGTCGIDYLNGTVRNIAFSSIFTATASVNTMELYCTDGILMARVSNSPADGYSTSFSHYPNALIKNGLISMNSITSFTLKSWNGYNIKAGSVIKIYGVRA